MMPPEHPNPSTFRPLMSIHINAATNPCGQDIYGPPTTTRLFCQRHSLQLGQIKAPATI